MTTEQASEPTMKSRALDIMLSYGIAMTTGPTMSEAEIIARFCIAARQIDEDVRLNGLVNEEISILARAILSPYVTEKRRLR